MVRERLHFCETAQKRATSPLPPASAADSIREWRTSGGTLERQRWYTQANELFREARWELDGALSIFTF
ncbi:MAG: hypothetical protein ACJ8BW_13780 [Ktedonobacteraceae bacterium]